MSNQLFFTPGPSQLYPTITQHLNNAMRENIGSISHRGKEFQMIFQEMKELLSDVLNIPPDYEVFITSSATEIWERIIQNLISNSSHHFVNGSFSKRFYDFTTAYQLKSTSQMSDFSQEFSEFKVPNEAELISITQNETSIGYSFNPEEIKNIRENNSEKLIALDLVSAVPSIPVDLSQIDTAYFSVQKCFGLPAGMGVWIVGPKCFEVSKIKEYKNQIVGSYHSLSVLKKNGDKNQTPETPNVLSLYLLKNVLKDMQLKGIPSIQNETKYKAALLYQTFDQIMELNTIIPHPLNRSKTVCVSEVLGGNKGLIEYLKSKQLIIGSGYGSFKDQHIRIANFPAHSKESIEMLVDEIGKYFEGK
jgi:phosphoserine aminotransferase